MKTPHINIGSHPKIVGAKLKQASEKTDLWAWGYEVEWKVETIVLNYVDHLRNMGTPWLNMYFILGISAPLLKKWHSRELPVDYARALKSKKIADLRWGEEEEYI